MTRGFCAVLSRVGLVCLLFAAMVGTTQASINLVANPGFETGDYTGWTQAGNTGFTAVSTLLPHTGSFSSQMGPVGSLGFLLQTIVPTTPGDTYAVSFWLDADSGGQSFDATFAGTTGYSDVSGLGHGYLNPTFTAVATAASSILQFSFRHDPAFYYLDDVSVTDLGGSGSVPEPSSLVVWSMLGFVGVAVVAVRQLGTEKSS